MRALLFALVLLAAVAPARAAPEARVLLTEVTKGEAIDDEAVPTLNRVLEGEVRRAVPDVELVTLRAVAANLEVAQMAMCLGDEEAVACATELGNAFGVDLVITPRVGRIGSQLVFTVSVYRLGDATVLGQATRRADDEEALLDLVGPAVEEALFPTGLRVVRTVAKAGPEPTLWPWVLGGAGLFGGALAVAAGLAVHGGAGLFLALPYTAGALSRDQARFWEGSAVWFLGAGWALYGVGALLGVSGVALGLVVE